MYSENVAQAMQQAKHIAKKFCDPGDRIIIRGRRGADCCNFGNLLSFGTDSTVLPQWYSGEHGTILRSW